MKFILRAGRQGFDCRQGKEKSNIFCPSRESKHGRLARRYTDHAINKFYLHFDCIILELPQTSVTLYEKSTNVRFPNKRMGREMSLPVHPTSWLDICCRGNVTIDIKVTFLKFLVLLDVFCLRSRVEYDSDVCSELFNRLGLWCVYGGCRVNPL
jgi:hypothetical protein